jgi:ATP-dependent Lon protease
MSSTKDNTLLSSKSDKKKTSNSKGKRKYVRLDEYEKDLDNQQKKINELENKLSKMISKNRNVLENKIKSNTAKINNNTEEIEELYDSYETSYTTDDSDTGFSGLGKPKFEVISGGSDLGKKLLGLLQGSSGETKLDSDITKIITELKIEDEVEMRAKCKEYANASKELKIYFGYDELQHFISSSDEYRDNILTNLKELINKKIVSNEPYTLKVMNSKMEPYTKQVILNKVNQLANMEPGMGDYYKLKRWVDTAINMPWGVYKKINVPNDKIGDYLTNARGILDNVIYGQEESKDIIIQIISKLITNTNAGNVFSLYGPAGVGKTTIIKNGLAKALNLPFAFISLGGATDASYLDGHSYTYEGSVAGKIVDIITKSGCMNPIIYFDELDKISNTAKGREIMNMLIHLTDPVQSSMFQDKYLGSIDIDLSKCIFVFSFNNIEKVSSILLDRMKLIYVNGFTVDEKTVITRDYLLPELIKEYNLYYDNSSGNIFTRKRSKTHKPELKPILELDEDNIKYIINYGMNNNGHFNTSEEGVRQIKQRLEKICSLINIVKITSGKWNGNIHSVLDNIPELKQYNNNENYPINLDNSIINKILNIKSLKNDNSIPFGMYC